MTMTYHERINVKHAKYLLSLPVETLIEIVTDDNNDNGVDWDDDGWNNPIVYAHQIRNWLKGAITSMEAKGNITTKYKYSKTLVKCGRIYVKGFGIQKCEKKVRGFLIKDFVNDYDMVNAHPSIICGLIKKQFPDLYNQIPHFRDYVKNRSRWIDEYKISKLDVIKALNKDKLIVSGNQYLVRLDRDIKLIQKYFWENFSDNVEMPETILAKKGTLKNNKYGKYLNCLISNYENNILQECIKMFPDVDTPMFDGFTLDKKYEPSEVINKLNALTDKHGVKWSVKEHSNEIEIDEGVEINFQQCLLYEDQKLIFEKTHFIIQHPLMFGRYYEVKGERKYALYKKGDFRDLVKPVKCWKISSDGKGKEAEFFLEWLEDSTHLAYKEIDFIPYLSENNQSDCFNSFKGFKYQVTMTREEVEQAEQTEEFQNVIRLFTNHLYHLSGHNEEGAMYLWNYIAHLFQKPEELPEVAIIIKGRQGHGKDSLINILEMLMTGYIFRTADLDDIFGSFNVGIRDKLVLVLNEVEGKNGFHNKEKLKNIITEKTSNIREKHVSIYDQTNYKRVLIFSNNFNPIEIPFDDRRFSAFQTWHVLPPAEYWDELYTLAEPENLQILLNYLMYYPIDNFVPKRDRPRTDAYNNMKEHNQNPFYKFIWKNFVEDGWKELFEHASCYKKKNKEEVVVNPTSLFQTYTSYLNCEDMGYVKPTFKIVASVLADIGVKKSSMRIGANIRGDFYTFNKEYLIDRLQSYNLEEEVEEYEEDDFELE